MALWVRCQAEILTATGRWRQSHSSGCRDAWGTPHQYRSPAPPAFGPAATHLYEQHRRFQSPDHWRRSNRLWPDPPRIAAPTPDRMDWGCGCRPWQWPGTPMCPTHRATTETSAHHPTRPEIPGSLRCLPARRPDWAASTRVASDQNHCPNRFPVPSAGPVRVSGPTTPVGLRPVAVIPKERTAAVATD